MKKLEISFLKIGAENMGVHYTRERIILAEHGTLDADTQQTLAGDRP